MRRGERQRFLVGTGHGGCTCQGAAFEYIVNLEFELRARKVRDKADITWISNEYELGDFGMGGMHVRMGGYVTPSKIFTESLFAERGLRWITRAHVRKVEPGRVEYETLDGERARGGLRLRDAAAAVLRRRPEGVRPREGADITARMFVPNGFMKVDADYTPKPYEQWVAADWPRTYQSPDYRERLRGGHRVRAAAPDLAAAPEPAGHADHAGAARARACRRP